MIETELTTFSRNKKLLEGRKIFLVVKSLDQKIRRQRLIEALNRPGHNVGRLADRPVSDGLLVSVTLNDESIKIENGVTHFEKVLREPRGISKIDDAHYLITDINHILLINEKGEVIDKFTHPYFAYLHSLDYDPVKKTVATVSSGYDALFQLDLNSRKVNWEWFGWDHGFNPRTDGVFLAHSPDGKLNYESENKISEYIDPTVYGEKGLFTGTRTMHPNSACYGKDGSTILATYGMQGVLAEIDIETGHFENRLEIGQPMPHGIFKMTEGWGITNTLGGEFCFLENDFKIREKLIFRNLPGKIEGLGQKEWVQSTVALDDNLLLGLDSNRGLVGIDVKKKEYCIIPVDENWCVQEALKF